MGAASPCTKAQAWAWFQGQPLLSVSENSCWPAVENNIPCLSLPEPDPRSSQGPPCSCPGSLLNSPRTTRQTSHCLWELWAPLAYSVPISPPGSTSQHHQMFPFPVFCRGRSPHRRALLCVHQPAQGTGWGPHFLFPPPQQKAAGIGFSPHTGQEAPWLLSWAGTHWWRWP